MKGQWVGHGQRWVCTSQESLYVFFVCVRNECVHVDLTFPNLEQHTLKKCVDNMYNSNGRGAGTTNPSFCLWSAHQQKKVPVPRHWLDISSFESRLRYEVVWILVAWVGTRRPCNNHWHSDTSDSHHHHVNLMESTIQVNRCHHKQKPVVREYVLF